MKNKISISIISLLLFFNGLLLYQTKLTKNQSKIDENTVNMMAGIFEKNFISEKENENLKLKNDLKLITVEGDTVYAKNIFKKGNLVLRYSFLNCRMCIDAEIDNLSKISLKFSNEISVITYQDNKRELMSDVRIFEEKGLKNIKIFSLLNDNLVPLDAKNVPYYFYINSELTMSNFFIPEKDRPQLSHFYLNSVLKNFK